ncbi:MAG TPA: NADH-quinone oxidoreductase subunit C [Candidatus Acidoferrales bacterium]|nr:NADH-quinone oxidoreductase subunit C [Candidatus Acidoferrales bacterium]
MAERAGQEATVVVERLRSWNPRAVESFAEFRGEVTIVIPRELLRDAAERLREDPGLDFNLLSDLTCVDRFPLEPRFELYYQLTSIQRRRKLCLRVRLSGGDPAADSLTSVWPGANWMEREVFDLFGIRFQGHPGLRRILLPDDWEGHPLRKDFPVEGSR